MFTQRPTPSAQPVIAVQGLTKTFRDFWMRTRARAVDNLSFSVGQGEVFGLLGPNGSGKSTTIKVILGLLSPSAGRVAVFGRPPSDVQIKRRIGYLPEESYLYPFLNARETLDYYGKLFGLDRRARRQRTDELLEMVGLASVQYRAVREYSKGMQRRIGLAQALINDPELLILDEPTSGLDPIGNRQVKDLIIELGRRGKSILLSSHLLADVEDCVHRMVILYGGQVQSEGTCDQLLARTDRSVIESDALDEATIAQIDELIRARSGGAKAISRVSNPRQSLEQYFMDIVERATAAKIATSGARHGGQTAAFLGASAPAGGEVIENLLRDDEPAPSIGSATPVPRPAPAPAGPDADVLGALVNPEREAPASAPPASARSSPTAPPAQAPDVDSSVIDALLGGGEQRPGSTP